NIPGGQTDPLVALLECPLCFQQLDVSAKVLPCQHTFCMSCLQSQEAAHSKLLCPECRAPVPAKTVNELPTNLLLVRLLEGLQGSQGPSRGGLTAHHTAPLSRGGLTVREGKQQESQHREKQGQNEVSARPWHYLGLCIIYLKVLSLKAFLCDFLIQQMSPLSTSMKPKQLAVYCCVSMLMLAIFIMLVSSHCINTVKQ
uniref:RING-type domain-containing protein n=1 Tax=Labrus bergylta TaxID=56723 RepID=A0A3Q3GNC0_9LABR